MRPLLSILLRFAAVCTRQRSLSSVGRGARRGWVWDTHGQTGLGFPELNPWLHIWTKPRQTIQYIRKKDSAQATFALAGVGGLMHVLDRLIGQAPGNQMGLPAILLIGLGGAMAGFINMYVVSGILAWTGSWFNGHASRAEIRHAYAWSNVPLIPLVLFWFMLLAIYGPARLGDVESLSTSVLLLFVATGIGLYIWSIVIFLKSVSEIQQLSMPQTMASVLLPVFLFAVPIALVLTTV
jgi:hypothetical protein